MTRGETFADRGAPAADSPATDDLQVDDGTGGGPKLRNLPLLTRHAVRLLMSAAPREFLFSLGLQIGTGVGVAALLLLTRNILAGVFSSSQVEQGLTSVLPDLVILLSLTAFLAFISSVSRELEHLLSEEAGRYAQGKVIDVASAVEMKAYEDPSFCDQLYRAAMGGQARPLQLVRGMVGLVGGAVSISGIIIVLYALQPLIVPFVFLAALPLCITAAKAGRVWFRAMWHLTPGERARAYLYLLLTSKEPAKELRAFELSGYLKSRYDGYYDVHIAELRRGSRHRLILSLVGSMVMATVLGATLAALIYLAAEGKMDIATAGTAAGAVVLLAQRLVAGATSIAGLYEAAPFLSEFNRFLMMTPESRISEQTWNPSTLDSGLVLDRVSFSYPGSTRQAVRQISLELKKGEVVALVGENGSGKTTVAKLISHLYRPDSGRILWDGVDTSALPPALVRRGVSVIFQDFIRYLLPVRENVGVGRYERMDNEEQIVLAARKAGAHDLICSLPAGYDTLLGPEFEGGTDLSQGQWQRVALARAIFRDAAVVVLDEPTAALDPEAEQKLLEEVRKICQDQAVLLISHRFSSVRTADRIYVVKNGVVVESGTHEELMERAMLYSKMFRLQADSFRDSHSSDGQRG